MRTIRVCYDYEHCLFRAHLDKHPFEFVFGSTEFVALGRLAVYYQSLFNLVVLRKKSGWSLQKRRGLFQREIRWSDDVISKNVCSVEFSFAILGKVLFSAQKEIGVRICRGDGFLGVPNKNKILSFSRRKRRRKSL